MAMRSPCSPAAIRSPAATSFRHSPRPSSQQAATRPVSGLCRAAACHYRSGGRLRYRALSHGLAALPAASVPRRQVRSIEPIVEGGEVGNGDGEQIKLVGELNDAAKGDLLRGAAALLFPIDWPEPFGLVMIEAMACGTPVIAYRRGSVPEVVDHGATGFVVDDDDGAIEAIRRIGELDRRQVRAMFERRFTATKMADSYLRHYATLLRKTRRAPVGRLDAAQVNAAK